MVITTGRQKPYTMPGKALG